VELNEGRGAFSELIGRRVRDTSGRSLGHVFEVRAHWEKDGTIVLDELLIGRLGLWRRLRGPGPDDGGIAWTSLVAVDDDFLTVRGT
jgi:sporulation protein YlmC with PRC-barrel domain